MNLSLYQNPSFEAIKLGLGKGKGYLVNTVKLQGARVIECKTIWGIPTLKCILNNKEIYVNYSEIYLTKVL